MPNALTSVVDGLDRVAEAVAARLLQPRVFLSLLALYVLALFLIKGLLYTGGLGHDVDQLVLSQSLAMGYDNRNPPLYTWLVYGAERLLGPGLAAVQLVKSSLVFLLFFFLYKAAALMLDDRRMAVLAALAPFALYFVAWWLAVKYSHTAILATACAATLYLVLRLERQRATLDYLLLGLCMGLGLLSKYNYAIFLAALLAALQFDPALRGALRGRGSLLAGGLALVIFAPHVAWVLVELPDFNQSVESRFGTGGEAGILARLSDGLLSVGEGIVSFMLPLGLAIPFLAWRARSLPADDGSQVALRRYFRFLSVLLLTLTLVIALLVTASGSTTVRKHYLFIFIPFPIWVVLWFAVLRLSRATVARFALAFAIFAATAPVVMAARFWVGPQIQDYPLYNLAYVDLAQELRTAGFSEGTIFAHDYPFTLSGNLRAYLPDARLVGHAIPHYLPPERSQDGACLLLWAVDRKSTDESTIMATARKRFAATETQESLAGGFEVPVVHGTHPVSFRYRLFPGGFGSCR